MIAHLYSMVIRIYDTRCEEAKNVIIYSVMYAYLFKTSIKIELLINSLIMFETDIIEMHL